MFSLASKLRCLALIDITPSLRCCYSAARTSEQFRRLPPGYGKTTPFGLYVKENFASRRNEQPTEMFSNLTKKWKSLSDDDKKKYFDEAVRVNEEKRSKFEALDEAEKEELRKKAQNLREYRLKRKIRLERRKKREGGQPRPLSGWMLFVKEKAVKGTSSPGKKQQDVIKELATIWKSFSENEKNAYNERAKAMSNAENVSG